jgi:predicted ATPase
MERWQRTKNGDSQVVLLSGEPGIGKKPDHPDFA